MIGPAPCPKCGSHNWRQERRPNGNTHCKDCNYTTSSRIWNTAVSISQIAKEELGIDTLETQNSDSLDFHEVSVWQLKKALMRTALVRTK